MAEDDRTLVFQRSFPLPPESVYRALVHPTALRDWLCTEAFTDTRPGGIYFLKWDTSYAVLGELLDVEPNRHLRMTWRGKDEPFATFVDFLIEPQGAGSDLRLAHEGIPASASWDHQREEFRAGWQNALESLDIFLREGVDPRLVNTPVMGVGIDEFDAAKAARLGIPKQEGVFLTLIGEGSAAQAAGLQVDDLVFEIDEHPVKDFPALSAILRSHQAGDTLALKAYRGSQMRLFSVVLAARPRPAELPTLAELVQTVERNTAEANQRLQAALDGVAEGAAAHRPQPMEWSAKEIIAHLIACERDQQTWIADMLNDHPVPDDLEYSPNPNERMESIVDVHPTLANLLNELKVSQEESLALLRRLPDRLIERKHNYRRIVNWLTETPGHFDEHIDQLKAALA